MHTKEVCKITLRSLKTIVAMVVLGGTTLIPQATAQPAAFPDLSQFTDADSGQYVRPFSYAERWANGYLFFKTPDGISCAIGGSSWCTGEFPGRPARHGGCDSVQHDGVDSSQAFAFASNDSACLPTTDAILGVGQKLTNTTFGITCVVGEGRLTACIQKEHGFVLHPSGSWVF